MDIILSKDQKIAINGLTKNIEMMRDKTFHNKFTSLSGYAGVGKTFLTSYLAQRIYKNGESIAFCALTGKAASVLRDKLEKANALYSTSSVSTIHSLIYIPVVDKKGKVSWIKKPNIEHDIIIIDEASMVNKELFKDLLTYNKPIVCIGDAGQLPAIGTEINLVRDADYKLTKIHRQCEDSPIIKMSLKARTDGILSRKTYGKTAIKTSFIFDPISQKIINNFIKKYACNIDSQMLCGMHYTRVKLNNMVRNTFNKTKEYAEVNEKIVCQTNDRNNEVYNGTHATVVEIINEDDSFIEMHVRIAENNRLYTTIASKKLFGLTKYDDVETFLQTDDFIDKLERFMKTSKSDNFNHWDFGYALTTHRAQGSEWENVLLFEEYNQFQTKDIRKRWLYTGITRAKTKLAVIEDFY